MTVRESSCYNNSKKPMKRVRVIRYYGYCGEKGYNSCTYTVEIEDIDNSNTSKKWYSITKLIIFYCYIKSLVF